MKIFPRTGQKFNAHKNFTPRKITAIIMVIFLSLFICTCTRVYVCMCTTFAGIVHMCVHVHCTHNMYMYMYMYLYHAYYESYNLIGQCEVLYFTYQTSDCGILSPDWSDLLIRPLTVEFCHLIGHIYLLDL